MHTAQASLKGWSGVVDREPNSPQEWEQWLTGTRKAIARQSLVASGRPGTPTGIRLVHEQEVVRAERTAAVLRLQQMQGGVVQRALLISTFGF